MRILFFLLFPIFLSAQINRAYGLIEIGATFPSSSSTGPKFAYRPADSSFYRWVSGNTWVKVVEPSITQDTLFLTEELGTTVKLNGDTINLTPYLLKSDTMSMLVRYIERGDTLGMLSAYIRSAGWGLLKSSYTLRADSSLLATKTYTNRFIVPSGQVAVGTGSGLAGYANLFWNSGSSKLTVTGNLRANNLEVPQGGVLTLTGDYTQEYIYQSGIGVMDNVSRGTFRFWTDTNNNDGTAENEFAVYTGLSPVFNTNALTPLFTIKKDGKIGFGLNTPLYAFDINSTDAIRIPRGTTVQRPTAALAILRGNTDNTSIEWYNGTRWATGLESTFARGTSTYVPHFDANGQLTQSGRIRWNGTLTEIYGSTNSYSSASKSLRVFSLNGGEMFWVNDNGQFGGDGFQSSQSNITLGSSTRTVPEIQFTNGAVVETFAKQEASDVVTIGRTYGEINLQRKASSGGSYPNGNFQIWSKTGINQLAPIRDLDVNGEVRIRDLTTDTPTQIVGADADGDLGAITISSDLKLASGTLGLKRKSLIDSLPLASVAIDAAGNNLSLNSLGTFTVDFNATAGSITSDGDITRIESNSEIHLITAQDARLDLTHEAKLSAPNLEGSNSFTVGYKGFYWNFVNTSAQLDSAFAVITSGDRKLLRAHGYGNGYVDATYTGEYPGKYILATTSNHNVMDYRIDRDTLVVDANLSVGTLLYYTQNLHVNLRMTALASTNSTITFPDASDVFRGKSIYIRVLEKDPGIYVPVINVAGGVSRLLYTSTTTTAPADQATLTMDNVTWPFFRTYKFTCLNTGTTPNYRWVLNQ